MKLTAFICLTLLLVGCTSTAIMDNILVPLAARVFDLIYPQIQAGLEDAVADGDLPQEAADYLLGEATKLRDLLHAGARAKVLEIDWLSLEPWAARGVQDMVDRGVISVGVATSLLQRIVNFRDLLTELSGVVHWNGTRKIYSETESINGDPVFLGYAPKVSFDM